VIDIVNIPNITQENEKMLSVVYFENNGVNIIVGAFLMRTDAEKFVKDAYFSKGYKIAEVDGQWSSWSNIREGITQ
jgi:hypothetical protein